MSGKLIGGSTVPYKMERVGRPYKTWTGAFRYAKREWIGSHQTDAAQWLVAVQRDYDGVWVYIAEAEA